jgi:preflagellin peptidase FlaK
MLDIITTDLLRVLVILPVLLYASYTDILDRRVDDKVWAIPTFLALILLSWDAYVSTTPASVALAALFSMITVGGVSYIIYHFRIFYGADYKAFLLIAILFPWHPEIGSLPIFDFVQFYEMGEIFNIYSFDNIINTLVTYSAMDLFGFTVFVNTTVFSITYFVINSGHNMKSGSFKIYKPLRSLCARQVRVSELDNIHAQIVNESKSTNKISQGVEFIRNGLTGLSTDFFRDYETWYCENKTVSQNVDINDIDDLDFDAFLKDNEDWASTNPEEDKQRIRDILARDTVWVTPGVPFIVPITLGLISALTLGNIMYIVLSLVI